MCSLQSLLPPSSALASFPMAAVPGDICQTHSPGNRDNGAQMGPSAQSWSCVSSAAPWGAHFPPALLWSDPSLIMVLCKRQTLAGLIYLHYFYYYYSTSNTDVSIGRQLEGTRTPTPCWCRGTCLSPWGGCPALARFWDVSAQFFPPMGALSPPTSGTAPLWEQFPAQSLAPPLQNMPSQTWCR